MPTGVLSTGPRTEDYEADFYNQFLSSPDSMISEEVAQRARGLANYSSLSSVHRVRCNRITFLEGSINALYGDFRNPSRPAALLEIEFFLHNEDAGDQRDRPAKALSEIGAAK